MIYHIPTCICHVCSSFIHLSFYSFKFFSDLEIQPHLLWVVFVSATKQEKEYEEISLVKHKTQTINSSNQSEFDCKFIIWLNLWVGKINKILYSDWLLGPTRRKKGFVNDTTHPSLIMSKVFKLPWMKWILFFPFLVF